MVMFCLLILLAVLENGLGYTIIQRPAYIDEDHQSYNRFTSRLGHHHVPPPPPPGHYWFKPPSRLSRDETHNLLELYYLIRVIGEYRQPVAHKTKLDALVEELQDQDLQRKLQRLLYDADGFDEITILGRYPHGQSTLDLLDKRRFVNDYRQLIPVIHRTLDAINLENELYDDVREKFEELKEHVNELTINVVQKEMDLYQELTATTERIWSIADILETIFGKQDQASMAALEKDYDVVVEDDDGKPLDSGEVEEFWVVIEDYEEEESKEELTDRETDIGSVEIAEEKEESFYDQSEFSLVESIEEHPVAQLPTYPSAATESEGPMVVPESVLPVFIYNLSSELSQEKLNNNLGSHITAAVDESNKLWEQNEEHAAQVTWEENELGQAIENSEYTEEADDTENTDSFEFKEENYERLTPEEEESDSLPTEERDSEGFEFEESNFEHLETKGNITASEEPTQVVVESKDDSPSQSSLVVDGDVEASVEYENENPVITENKNLDSTALDSSINTSSDVDFEETDNAEAVSNEVATAASNEVVNSLTFPEELQKPSESTEPIVEAYDIDPRVDPAGFPAHYNQPNVVFESERLPQPIDVSQPADLIEPEEEEQFTEEDASLQEFLSKPFVESETGMLLEAIDSTDMVDVAALVHSDELIPEDNQQQVDISYEDYSEEADAESATQSVPLWLQENVSAVADEDLQELEESLVDDPQRTGELNVYEIPSNHEDLETREDPILVRTAEFDPNALRYVTDEIIKMVGILEESSGFPGLRKRISNQDLDRLVDRLSQVEIMKMIGDQGINRIEMINALQKLIKDNNMDDGDRIVNVLELWKEGEDPQPDEGFFSKNYGDDVEDGLKSRVLEEEVGEVAQAVVDEEETQQVEGLVDELEEDLVEDVELHEKESIDDLEQFLEQGKYSQPDDNYFSKNYGTDAEDGVESRVLEDEVGDAALDVVDEQEAQHVEELVDELEEDIVEDVDLQAKQSVDDLEHSPEQIENLLTHDGYFEKTYGVDSDRMMESRVVGEKVQAVTNGEEAQNAEELIDELEDDILADAELHKEESVDALEEFPREEASQWVSEGIQVQALDAEETEPSTEGVESRIVTGVEQIELHHVDLQKDSNEHGKDRDRIEVLSEEMTGFMRTHETITEQDSPQAQEESQAASETQDEDPAPEESKSEDAAENDHGQNVESSVGEAISSQDGTETKDPVIDTTADLPGNDLIEADIEGSPSAVLEDETIFTIVGDGSSSVPEEPVIDDVLSEEVVDDVKREHVQPFPDELPDETEPLAVDRASADENAMSERQKEMLADKRPES